VNIIETRTEYAIEVPGRGYIGFHGILRQGTDLLSFNEFDSAVRALESGRGKYISMGCPEVAETLRIVTRTVTITCSDWEAAALRAVAE
jgi:hypothetical protein